MPKKKKQKTASNYASSSSGTESKKNKKAPAIDHEGPLYRCTTNGVQQTRLLDSYPDLLSDLLSPGMTTNTFLTQCFRRQAVHVPNDISVGLYRTEKIQDEMLNLNVQHILEQTASENIFVWLPTEPSPMMDPTSKNGHGKHQQQPDKKINSIEVPDAETAFALYQAGHATYCRAPPRVEELLVSALLENTGLGCGQYDASGQSMTSLGRAEVETFISTRVGSVTGWHTDFQENFTIHLSGRKKWSLQKGTVANVLRGVTPHYSVSAVEGQIKAGRLDQPDFAFGPPTIGTNAIGPVEQVILEPGDVLYFPAGMWHKIEVLEPGISINCSLMATNYATLVCQSLQHLLLQRPEWRASICRPRDGSTVTETVDTLIQTLPDIIQDWTRQGAAQGMLPPVLQHGEVVAPGDENGWKEMGDDDDSNDDEEEEAGEETSTVEDSIKESLSLESDNGDGVSDDPTVNLDDDPPETAEFDPSLSALRKKLETHHLGRNPLALLIDENDILRRYQKNGKVSKIGHAYILNVNYAGNEAHESFLRVRIQTDQAKLDGVPVDKMAKLFLEKKPNVIGWLLYLGYLVWVPRKP
eukprot:scaffold2353_cov167-Amphora_coffeaeformis.AAC.63